MPSQGSSRDSQEYAPLTDLAPRSIPPLVYLQVFTGGFSNQFGLLWLCICLPVALLLGGQADLKSLSFARQPLAAARGVVQQVTATGSSENDRTIYAIDYRYSVPGQEGATLGRSYSSAFFQPDQQVVIDYQVANPAVSRLRGTRMAPFGPGILVFMSLFAMIGVGFLGFGLRRSLEAARLLAGGRMAQATLVRKERTNTTINDRPVYKLIFAFVSDQGTRHEVVTKTHQPELVLDSPRERVLYNPRQPSQAALVDTLPGRPRLDELGRVRPGGLGGLLLTGLLLALVGLVLFLVVAR